MIEPGRIAAGDSLSWTRSLTDYKAGDGWTLHYALLNAAGAYTIDSTADGDNHAVSVTSATTTAWAAGRYDWTAYVTHTDGRRKSLFTGVIIITPDLTSGTPYDGRSHARKMLDAIEAAIENRATADELDLLKGQFGPRAIERNSAELIVHRDKYRREVNNEERAAALARGEKSPRNIKIRFR
jgi:hypothetical protein